MVWIKKIKAVITQNTLGIPCKIEKISQFCLENDSLLIEDLAHSVGTTYDDGKTAGTVGDMVVFSFSQDKLIDAVSGGALIIRNQKFTHFSFSSFNKHSLWGIIKDRTYPANTFKIRKLYPLGLGKLLHQFFKLINILPKPVESDPHMYEMKSWQAQLALFQFQDLNKNMQHRKSIAKIYAKELDDKITNKTINNLVNQSSCLRFPIFAEKRSRLISFLKQHGIYVSDIWYDAPISPKRYMKEIKYKGNCKVAEEISETIINLPTHRNVSEIDAQKISFLINKCLQ